MDNQDSFREFTASEVDVGLDYAAGKKGLRLTREILRIAGNQAGAIRKAQRVTPRVAAVQALRAYEWRNGIDIGHDRYEGYIAGIAKMLSERSPKTRHKREVDKAVAELKAAAA